MAINPSNWGYTPNYVQNPTTMEWEWTGRPETSWMQSDNEQLTSKPWIENVIPTSGRVPAPTTGLDINNAMVVRGPDGRLYNAFQAGLNPFEFQVTNEGRLRSSSNQGDTTYFDSPIAGFTNIGGTDYILTDPRAGLPGYQTYAPPAADAGFSGAELVPLPVQIAIGQGLLSSILPAGGLSSFIQNPVVQGAARAAAQGGDLQDILKGGAVGGLSSLAGSTVGELVGGDLGKVASGAAAAATRAGLTGQDIGRAALLGGASAGASEALKNLTAEPGTAFTTSETMPPATPPIEVNEIVPQEVDQTYSGFVPQTDIPFDEPVRQLTGETLSPQEVDQTYSGFVPQTDIPFDEPVRQLTGETLSPQEVAQTYPELYPGSRIPEPSEETTYFPGGEAITYERPIRGELDKLDYPIFDQETGKMLSPDEVAATYPDLYPGGVLPQEGEVTTYTPGTSGVSVSPSVLSQVFNLGMGIPTQKTTFVAPVGRYSPSASAMLGAAASPSRAMGEGDIESSRTGGKRKNVWNIASLRNLQEGLGV